MLQIHRERCRRDGELVRDGERELAAIADELQASDDLPALAAAIEAAGSNLGELETAAAGLERLDAAFAALAEAARRLEAARARAEATRDLPEAGELPSLRARIEVARGRERVGERLLAALRERGAAETRLLALAGLPAAPPALRSSVTAQALADRLAETTAAITRQRARLKRNEADRAAVEREVAALAEETGGLCPACGAPVEPASLLESHAHPGREAA
jgi:DNA repair exonuclease SbcCD ATPase subunit